MNPILAEKYGFKKIIIKPPGRRRGVAWVATISGRQVCLDERCAGDEKSVLREIEIARLLATTTEYNL
jgi:hypothetical protein